MPRGCQLGRIDCRRTRVEITQTPPQSSLGSPARAAALAIVAVSRVPSPPPAVMPLDKKFLQRAILAFTTGLFLACAARVSSASGQTAAPAPSSITR